MDPPGRAPGIFHDWLGLEARIPLDTLVPQIDATDRSGGLDNFVESRRQNFKEIRPVPVKSHQSKANARPKSKATK